MLRPGCLRGLQRNALGGSEQKSDDMLGWGRMKAALGFGEKL